MFLLINFYFQYTIQIAGVTAQGVRPSTTQVLRVTIPQIKRTLESTTQLLVVTRIQGNTTRLPIATTVTTTPTQRNTVL